MKDKKLRIEDALSATKAAVEEGIVAGGGTAYINIIPEVAKAVEKLEGDEKIGGKIILRALEEPVKQIAVNAGLEPAVILEKVKSEKDGIGFDAKNEEYVDMKKAGNSRSNKSFKKCFTKCWINCINDTYNRKHCNRHFQKRKNAAVITMLKTMEWEECTNRESREDERAC